MHPRITELISYLDAQRAALREAVDSVPQDKHDQRPAPDRWSVSEVLEHVSLVERRLTAMFSMRFAEARTNGLRAEHDTTSVAPMLAVVPVLDRRRTVAAGEAVRPGGAVDVASAWTALEGSRRELRALIIAHDGLALGDVVHPHPVFGPLNMYQWIGFAGGHEARHAAQIREIGAQLAPPG